MPSYGRVPSPEDDRDLPLEPFLHIDKDTDPLQAALNVMLASKGANPAVKNWAKIATARILGNTPNPNPPPPPPTPSGKVSWDNPRTTLDQGAYGTCVGNGTAQWGNTSPINDNFVEKDARALYYQATIYDGSPDDPDAPGGGQQGATVRSGMKALQKAGRLSAYASANSLDTAIAWVQQKGPVVMGTDFTYNMEEPDKNGLVHYKSSDDIAGGHCYLMTGYDPSTKLIEFLNSWGPDWALNGRFYMSQSEYQSLYSNGGEAWTAVELALS